jgi:4-hydroxy-4-methyl-2-oxoglutarate aldolase
LSHGHTGATNRTRLAQSDIALFTHLEKTLYTAVVSDALDDLGFRDRVMADHLRPLDPSVRFAGWARTIACVDVHHLDGDPYAIEIEAVDSILPGEVVVVSTGRSKRNAPWGELLSTAAIARGARGAVVDGLVRDVTRIQQIGFPVFAAGIKPVDSKGRGIVREYNVPVECGAVLVSPGDLIFADFDGVVAIPAAVIESVVSLATEKASRESHSRDELRKGAYLRDVYKKYGVL